MKKVIVLVAILCFLGAGGYLRADYAHIGLDGKFLDWDSVTKVSDPNDDDVSDPNDPNDSSKVHDIIEVAMANDETNLYFYARVDDADNDEFGGDDVNGVGTWEEIYFYLDTDNNSTTGTPIGPNSYTIGANCRLRIMRRTDAAGEPNDPNAGFAWGQSVLYIWNGSLWISAQKQKSGIPCPVRRLTGVNEMEGRVQHAMPSTKLYNDFFKKLLHIGDTITYTVVAWRLNSKDDPNAWETDWLDTPQSYTIVPGCSDPNHPYIEGDMNRDCRVNYEDIAILTQDWVMCTEPNKPGCADLGWY